tara:strand:+ start:754 stop:1185 length:432 start_codon:yes stop_codon:yes gene_type:complete
MSWAVKILRAEKRNDKWKSAVEYTNGVDTFSKGYTLDPLSEAKAAGMLRAKIAELDAFDSDVFPFPIGEVLDLTIPTVTPAEPTPPTEAELAKRAWLNDFYLMEKYQRLIAINVLNVHEPVVKALKSSLATDYLPEYLEFIKC